VHATFYIEHQSAFNESLASFVADRLTESYFAQAAESSLFPLAGSIGEWKAHEKRAIRKRERLHAAYGELSALYANRGLTEPERLARKGEILDRVRAELKLPSERPLNNATLIQFKTYFTGQEEFAGLLDGPCGGDWNRFWKMLEPLRARPEKRFERRQLEDFSPVLRALAESKRDGAS
jgi:predicted aminopeptidase